MEYMLWLIWSFLVATPACLKNPIFALILSTQDELAQLMSDSLLVFADGLLDVLRSPTPPSIAYFKSLPTTDGKKRWAVYLLVLEKSGSRPLIYIGSATGSARGVLSRFYEYDNKMTLPAFIQSAFRDGFTISHKGLLCWAPIPPAVVRFPVRALFVLMEGVLSFVLWAMVSRTKDYAMPHFCPWEIEALDYDGCCNHNPLTERITGWAEGLTLEQIAAKQVDMERRRQETY